MKKGHWLGAHEDKANSKTEGRRQKTARSVVDRVLFEPLGGPFFGLGGGF